MPLSLSEYIIGVNSLRLRGLQFHGFFILNFISTIFQFTPSTDVSWLQQRKASPTPDMLPTQEVPPTGPPPPPRERRRKTRWEDWVCVFVLCLKKILISYVTIIIHLSHIGKMTIRNIVTWGTELWFFEQVFSLFFFAHNCF